MILFSFGDFRLLIHPYIYIYALLLINAKRKLLENDITLNYEIVRFIGQEQAIEEFVHKATKRIVPVNNFLAEHRTQILLYLFKNGS